LKYSILLPTRNRLEYLKLAVESVLRQDVRDWQLVVSDNRSEQDVEGYVASVGDPRIVYRRTERLVPVTENWNRALAHSEGEYIVMLGDDDALLGNYLRRMEELTQEFNDPDLIYTKALLFTYPGVDPAHPGGYLMDYGEAEFFEGASRPFVLDHARAVDLVRAAMSFRLRYDYNAQFAVISRRLIDSVCEFGDFYQSSFPDFYSMNAAFLRARRIVVDPSPKVVIGVTPKSYGYFQINKRETEGRTFLEGAAASTPQGSNINVGWLNAMTTLEQGVGVAFQLQADRRRYRLVQAAHVYQQYRGGTIDKDAVRRLERELPLRERWGYRLGSATVALVYRLVPSGPRARMVTLASRLIGQLPARAPEVIEGRYGDVLEVCDAPGVEASVGSAQPSRGREGEELSGQGSQEQQRDQV
jgi:glycosyltransferase involved in cell wall biosynthesis